MGVFLEVQFCSFCSQVYTFSHRLHHLYICLSFFFLHSSPSSRLISFSSVSLPFLPFRYTSIKVWRMCRKYDQPSVMQERWNCSKKEWITGRHCFAVPVWVRQEEITDHTEWVTFILTVCLVNCLRVKPVGITLSVLYTFKTSRKLFSNPLTSLNLCFPVKYFMIYFTSFLYVSVKLPHHCSTKWRGKSQCTIPKYIIDLAVFLSFWTVACSSDL